MPKRARLKRKIIYAEGMSPTGEGYVRFRIPRKDIGFYKVRGFSIIGD